MMALIEYLVRESVVQVVLWTELKMGEGNGLRHEF